ncbi:MAG: sirohydrochlorin cobaltochelatase [Thermoproteota archaeon]|nr:sirohydrochlorin cobaltochelatase [Thermoproteota archaeon]
MKKAMLIIDRGSREPEVKEELGAICEMVKEKGGYNFTAYCFLEVLPPFIEEGIKRCVSENVDLITVMPYFLYPGMKLKESVKKCARLCHDMSIKAIFAKPLSYHLILQNLLIERIEDLKSKMNILSLNKDCDVLVIGHGSSDKAARTAFEYTVNGIVPFYRSVNFCFLELDKPNIESGVRNIVSRGTRFLIVVPYFLHKGAHTKKDVRDELNSALAKYRLEEAYVTEHLGANVKMVNLVLERAREAESNLA